MLGVGFTLEISEGTKYGTITGNTDGVAFG